MSHTRLCIVADVHCGPDSPTKKGGQAVDLLRHVIDFARVTQPDVLLDLGDRISDVDLSTDRRNLVEVAARLGSLRCHRIHLLGNHDVGHLSPADNAEILASPVHSRVVELDPCRIVVWQPDMTVRAGGFAARTASLPWLAAALTESDKPAVVVSHVPVSGQAMTGNYYFENNPGFATLPDHAEIRRVALASGRVALWLSGHVHWNSVTMVGGIPFVTIQSLTESFTTPPGPSGCFADLQIKDGMFELAVRGRDPFHLRLPFRASGQHPWLAPYAPPPRQAMLHREPAMAG
ncbi:metallophosphoesterase family protein [Geminicoccus roseus]|uniref:metallophosphoesterase family protein n=1 Tax=Geminicoccus roseus TaxID=404900 RepID=UPI0004182EB3|nr:metallophosphoesterase [Geminicoccus roseus]